MELLCTLNTAIGVYENSIMIKAYGLWAIVYIIVSVILTSKYNRGAFGSPLPPFEAFFKKNLSSVKLGLVLLAEVIALSLGYPIARTIWANTFWLLDEHQTSYNSSNCELAYKAPIFYAMIYEMVNGFLMRTAFLIPGKLKAVAIPVVFMSSLTFAGKYIGSPGITPILAASRFLGCQPLSPVLFFIIYWIAPLAGWMMSSKVFPGAEVQKSKEKTN
uniref:Very-long-chain (3R)-3-hydroxyacyl-CoA dehydratase n=1 Tax=Steinernema glaseri TaxID=37863 RepID=A0A1I8AK62_9BILA